MTCSSCGEHPKKKDNSFTKAVVEINNPETLTLLRKVVIPASLGDEESVPPVIGKYHNVLLYYETNHHSYLYSSDGIPTFLEAEVPQEVLDRITNLETGLSNEIINRKGADTALDNRLTTVEGIANTAVQPATINKVVMTDISLNANTSTTTVQIDGAKENLLTGAQTTKNLPLPVASSVQAGVMNSSTFDAISNNTSDINAMMNGAVAITGLSASPSQADLTTAWEAETGLTTLMNRAGIYDVTNDKVWTYYTNSNTWYAASNSAQVTINTFTNSSEGTIKGSTNVGQIFAENDGTGSVNGWDTLSNNVTSLQANKQDNLTAGDNITIASNVISATNYTARGYGLTELKVYIDAVNGNDTNDGSDMAHAMKTVKAALLRYANKEHQFEIKLYLASGNTYTVDGYIINGVSIHFEPVGTDNANTTINFITLGSNYNFAVYNSHMNFVGKETKPITVNVTNGTTVYLDSGNLQASYTTFNCIVALWSAGSRLQNCTLNRKLRLMSSSVILERDTISAIEALSANISAWRTTINTNSSDNTDGYYWNLKACVVSLFGMTYVNIATAPTVPNFLYTCGGSFYLGAVLNKNNNSTKKFSGENSLNGGTITAVQNRYDSLKAMVTSSAITADVIKSSGLTL